MDEFEIFSPKYTPHPFLTRGCCQTPKPYQKNEGVYQHRCSKFDSYDWLGSIPTAPGHKMFDVAEVRFKNSRKDFYRIPPDLDLKVGEIVAVEASPGHDIGIVSLTGDLIRLQLRKKKIDPASQDIKKIYRRAKLTDIEKWVGAVENENNTLFKSRGIAEGLGLLMKINDVEYQGDNTKAIFYYTAEDRVDFRELIKKLAEEFKVRIEMRQIGARQEASRLGGIGSCGRELCCATWMTDFHSVTTQAARVQQLALNPQKLAGQCGKLKCCLNYEYDTYIDALKEFPDGDITLRTKKGDAHQQKADIFGKTIWYAYKDDPSNLIALPADKALFILSENKKGNLPDRLEDFARPAETPKEAYASPPGEEDLYRFDNF
jgi:cell fate regulator YaaT (PSP1 superfamily)